MEFVLEWKRTRFCKSELSGRMSCALFLILAVIVAGSIGYRQRYVQVSETPSIGFTSVIHDGCAGTIFDIPALAKRVLENVPRNLSDSKDENMLSVKADVAAESAVPMANPVSYPEASAPIVDTITVTDIPVEEKVPIEEEIPAGIDIPSEIVTVPDVSDDTEEAVPDCREIKGFLVDESGFICGYQDVSVADIGILVFPSNVECTGIRSQAFSGLEDLCVEIFIPANVTHIEAGAFEELSNLIYIEVNPDNPVYYSEYGVLYNRNGDLVCVPGGR